MTVIHSRDVLANFKNGDYSPILLTVALRSSEKRDLSRCKSAGVSGVNAGTWEVLC